MNRLRNSIILVRNGNIFRSFSSTPTVTGAHKDASGHGHGDDHSHDHGHGHGHHEKPKIKETWLLPGETEHYYRGYTYRELRDLQGQQPAQIIRYALGVMWFYIFYSLWKKPEDLFGHATYPDTSKWTDEELGIPPDDAE